MVNPKEKPNADDHQKSGDKTANVYDRLYNARTSKERNKANSSLSKSTKKIVKNAQIEKTKQTTPTRSEKHSTQKHKGANTPYSGLVDHGQRRRVLASNNYFSLSDSSRNGSEPKERPRQPTPVANKAKQSHSQARDTYDQNNASLKNMNVFTSERLEAEHVPKFASE